MSVAASSAAPETVLGRLLRVAADVIRQPADLRPEDLLMGGRISLDSLKLVELFAALEREFAVTISDEQVVELIGLAFVDIANVLERRVNGLEAHV